MGSCESCSNNKEIQEISNNSLVRIEFENDYYKVYTGFFLAFNIKNHETYFIITCNHLITKEDIDSKEKINIYYGKYGEEKSLNIELNKRERFIKYYKDLDATLIEVHNEDYIPKDKYLSPDLNYNFNQQENAKIYTSGYANFQNLKSKKFFSSGKITKVEADKKIFYHNLDERNSSPGSPIITNNKLVIGMNIGSSQDKKYNYGVFIKDIIERVNEDIDKLLQIYISNDPSIASFMTKANKFKNYFRNVDETGMVDPQTLGLLLRDPEYVEFVKNFYSNPKLLQLLSEDENFQKNINKDPYLKLALENPDAVLQFLTPENIKLFSNMLLGIKQ